MVVLRRAMLGAGAHRDPVLSILSGDDHPESAAQLRQAHYLISQTACSRPTTPSSQRLAKPGAASSPSPPPSAQSDTATGRTWVRNEGRWYKSQIARSGRHTWI